MTKRSWQVTVPGYRSFTMGGSDMDYAEALATARSIWPMAEGFVMSNDKMREEFEAWASENGMVRHLARAESGLYVSRVTQNYMDCWMASRAGQAAEVEALRESDQESTELCDFLSVLLGEIAVAVRGPEEPRSRHGFHDLPSRVKTVVGERDQLKAEVEALKGLKALAEEASELYRADKVRLSGLLNDTRGEVRSLRKLLLEASEEVATWGAYASEYFQEKHDLAGCVARLHDAAMSKESGHD